MERIALHIGFLKTASTTLQAQYFPACHGVNYIQQATNNKLRSFIREVTNHSPAYFNRDKCVSIFDQDMCGDKLNLISAENLSGQLLATVATPGLDFREQILKNLSTSYPQAKILIVIRKQDAMVNSIYREYLRQGGTEKVRRFYGEDGKNRPPIISRDYFFYKPYIDLLHSLFPAGVQVLCFENLVENPSQFLRKIDDFLGITHRDFEMTKSNSTRLGEFGLECTRVLNKLFKSQLNPGGFLPGLPVRNNGRFVLRSPVKMLHNSWPGKGKISKSSVLHQIGEKIFQQVQEDNQALDEAYSLDLKKFGYWQGVST